MGGLTIYIYTHKCIIYFKRRKLCVTYNSTLAVYVFYILYSLFTLYLCFICLRFVFIYSSCRHLVELSYNKFRAYIYVTLYTVIYKIYMHPKSHFHLENLFPVTELHSDRCHTNRLNTKVMFT